MELAFSPGLERPPIKAGRGARGPVTFRLHQALAASAPEPLTRCELAQRLGEGLRTVDRALQQNLQAGCIVPMRRLDDRHGHAYTVAGGGAIEADVEHGGAHG